MKLQELIKMEKKSQKPYLADYDLLAAQDLCQAQYQILLIVFLKEFIKLNAKVNIVIKNGKRVEITKKIAFFSLKAQTSKVI